MYTFFVTYARLDGWTPPAAGFDPDYPEGPAPQSDNLLDRWVLARLNQVVAQVEKGVDASDFASAALAVNAFLDDLTNWYVRRSRRRFWKSEHDADKSAAYATLYHVLVKLARTLAPFTPFVTEVMYQNLVRGVYPEAYESVHHTLWPRADAALQDELAARADGAGPPGGQPGPQRPLQRQPQGAPAAEQGAGVRRAPGSACAPSWSRSSRTS